MPGGEEKKIISSKTKTKKIKEICMHEPQMGDGKMGGASAAS